MDAKPLDWTDREWTIRNGRRMGLQPEQLAESLQMDIDLVRVLWEKGPMRRNPETGEPEPADQLERGG